VLALNPLGSINRSCSDDKPLLFSLDLRDWIRGGALNRDEFVLALNPLGSIDENCSEDKPFLFSLD
jgi:hypothetical protein